MSAQKFSGVTEVRRIAAGIARITDYADRMCPKLRTVSLVIRDYDLLLKHKEAARQSGFWFSDEGVITFRGYALARYAAIEHA